MVSLLAVMVMLLGVTSQVQAQSVTNALVSAEQYFTSFNTNYSWQAVKLSFATGTKEQTDGTGIGNTVELDGFIHTNYIVGLSGDFGAEGTAFNTVEGVFKYEYINHYDLIAGPEVYGGYSGLVKDAEGRAGAFVAEPGFFVEKLMTDNYFTELDFTKPIETVGKFSGNITIMLKFGFKF